MIAEPDEIERVFAEAGPWQSRFLIDGRMYGGELPYQEDGRVADFFDWVGTPTSVLELGSLEGAHSAQLAAARSVERLLCLEGREENVRRARTAMAVLGLTSAYRWNGSTSKTPSLASSAASTPPFVPGSSTT